MVHAPFDPLRPAPPGGESLAPERTTRRGAHTGALARERTWWKRAAGWTAAVCGVLLVGLLHLVAAYAAALSWVVEDKPYGDSESERAAIIAFLALLLELPAALCTMMLARTPARRLASSRWPYLPLALIVCVAVVGIGWGPLYRI